MRNIISMIYDVMDKRLLKALSLIMALLLAACIFFVPAAFAAKTSNLAIWHGVVLIWSVCAGVVYGVGFRPRSLFWQAIFCPPLAVLVMLAGLIFFFGYA